MPISDFLNREVGSFLPKWAGPAADKLSNRLMTPNKRRALMYLGAPLAAYTGVNAAISPNAEGRRVETDRDKWERIQLGHMAGGGMLGGILGAKATKLLAPGKLRMATPLLGAAAGALAGGELTAPFHYMQAWKTRRAKYRNYPGMASAQSGLPFPVDAGSMEMSPWEIRRRQLLGI